MAATEVMRCTPRPGTPRPRMEAPGAGSVLWMGVTKIAN